MVHSERLSRQARVLAVVQDYTQAMLLSSDDTLTGVHAGIVAEKLQMDRANVARELNNLYRNGQLIKIQGKPTLYICRSLLSREYPNVFFPSTLPKGGSLQDFVTSSMQSPASDPIPASAAATVSNLETMVGAYKTLKSAILHAKAAVMYPSHDLHILITGNVGVGKESLAQEMYTYAIQKGSLAADAPFVAVNCREQNVSPQLLLNQIFGCTRDAALKGEKAQRGLIERAAGGILYLNGIEKLPTSVQDALKTLLEKNTYTRIGEASVIRYSNAMIIATSTESPDSPSIAALRQRFSVRIHIPDLSSWSPREIMELLIQAFQKEAASTGLSFQISKETFAVFLRASYPGNLGDLTSTVRTTCALVFQDFVSASPQPKIMEIRLHHLQSELLLNVREDARLENRIRKLFQDLDLEYLNFNSSTFSSNRFVASQILKKLHHEPEDLEETSGHVSPLLATATNLTQPYFDRQFVPEGITFDTIEHYFPSELLLTSLQTLTNFPAFAVLTDEPENLYLLISCLSDAIQDALPSLDNAHLLWLRLLDICPFESSCATALCEAASNSTSDNARIYLTMLLKYLRSRSKAGGVPILAVFHGNRIAEEMANYVNSALGVSNVTGLSAPENMTFQEVLEKVSSTAQKIEKGRGILLAVDMDPFTNLHEYLFQATGIHAETVSNVSLPLLLSIGQLALREDIALYDLSQEIMTMTTANAPLPNSSFLNRTVNEILAPSLTFLNPHKAIDTLGTTLNNILKELDIIQSNEISIKFIFHGSHMLERLISGDSLKYDGLKAFVNQHNQLIAVLEKHMTYISEIFGISIPVNELAYIAEILLPYLN